MPDVNRGYLFNEFRYRSFLQDTDECHILISLSPGISCDETPMTIAHIFTEEEECIMRTLCGACGNERGSDRLAREVVLCPAC